MSRMIRSLVWATSVGALMLGLAACGDDSSDTSDDGASAADTGDAAGDNDGDAAASTSGGGGVLVVDGETVELDMGRCYLEPQESAGGGGMILATAQGSGTNAAGQELVVDFTRYDEESMFHGDDITLNSMDGSLALQASFDEGTVSVAESEVRSESVDLQDLETGDTTTVSFSIGC